jgi:hypothetical protein
VIGANETAFNPAPDPSYTRRETDRSRVRRSGEADCAAMNPLGQPSLDLLLSSIAAGLRRSLRRLAGRPEPV